VKKLFYRIGEACKQLDIQPYVLRYWETEFPVLSPKKSKAGQRVYSEEELRLILRIKQLLYEEGYTIAGAKKKLEAELAADTLPELGDALAEPPAAPPVRDRAAGAGRPAVASVSAAGGPGAVGVEDASDTAAGGADPAAGSLGPVATEPSLAEGSATTAIAGPTRVAPEAAAPAPALDRVSAEQVETLRAGVREALAQTRGILALLGD
jgi:DNA-binding transcriptional MerR regulator